MKPTSLRVLMNGLTSSFVPDIAVDTVVTDSRQVTPGSVFVAIVGENFDGNDYAEQAL
ncbi:MAG: UDP-N-acetylmuramoyl-tripeptide--D-alanyl-D-alanine ligase, partial [Oscillospiraceae bacterium]|nr:UDP-N-acetylmuramoyl-tripeptide--D-alanyl-D-alanine ligase [Oscillospiraceae bacterium]